MTTPAEKALRAILDNLKEHADDLPPIPAVCELWAQGNEALETVNMIGIDTIVEDDDSEGHQLTHITFANGDEMWVYPDGQAFNGEYRRVEGLEGSAEPIDPHLVLLMEVADGLESALKHITKDGMTDEHEDLYHLGIAAIDNARDYLKAHEAGRKN
jgi:hypothetical protein